MLDSLVWSKEHSLRGVWADSCFGALGFFWSTPIQLLNPGPLPAAKRPGRPGHSGPRALNEVGRSLGGGRVES